MSDSVIDQVPNELVDDLKSHVRGQAIEAEDGWEAGEDDEDVLTGHLGAKLQTKWKPFVDNGNRLWKWRIRYKKFRGRGLGAEEKLYGADGIIQLEVDDEVAGTSAFKGLLFQSKKTGNSDRKKLLMQTSLMQQISPKGCAVFEYGPNAFRAVTGRDLLRAGGSFGALPTTKRKRLGDFLSDDFLPCSEGVRGLRFDFDKKILVAPAKPVASTDLPDKERHAISIEIERVAAGVN